MGLKNSLNFALDKVLGALSIVTSAAQKTTNFQAIDNYNIGALFSSTADASVVNTTTETSLFGTGTGIKTLPANFLTAAKTVKITLTGVIAATLTPTLRLKVKLGSTVIIDTTAVALLTITGTNLWWAEIIFTCRTTGAGGTVRGQGIVFYYTGVSGLSGIASPTLIDTAVDATASQVIDVTATWGTASTGNQLICTDCLIEASM